MSSQKFPSYFPVGKGKKKRRISLLLAYLSGVITLPLLLLIYIHFFLGTIETPNNLECLNNAKQIMLSLKMYARKYDGALPDQPGIAGMQQLREKTISDYTRIFICPLDENKTKAKPGVPITEENISYRYFGAGKGDGEEITEIPIICCDIHQTVGYGNAHVTQYNLEPDEFHKMIQSQLEAVKKAD